MEARRVMLGTSSHAVPLVWPQFWATTAVRYTDRGFRWHVQRDANGEPEGE